VKWGTEDISPSRIVKKPARVWGSFIRWTGCEMRSRQVADTHLKRQTDLAGRRERISMTRSSVRLDAGHLLLFDLLPFAISRSSKKCKWSRSQDTGEKGERGSRWWMMLSYINWREVKIGIRVRKWREMFMMMDDVGGIYVCSF
jgi:hypothetical protein